MDGLEGEDGIESMDGLEIGVCGLVRRFDAPLQCTLKVPYKLLYVASCVDGPV